ncbi:cucumisin-like, partial [Lycium barbarum]|uniref:cucumisin-like n=1 Tax=Lycium barbarum TaxID=112863 RepID=UPI00293F3781
TQSNSCNSILHKVYVMGFNLCMDAVVSVFPNGRKELHTTRSWDFLGFPRQVIRRTSVESDLIIGMLDTGIWPESQSFDDDDFSAPPSKWKGSCQASPNFTCNKKIIGAKYYRVNGEFPEGDIQSPRDTEGHGSHTASTAAGRSVSKANLYGLGSGTARGGVPSARIAVYKICWSDGCFDADILAAFDDAIADGVDIISLSVGGSSPYQYFEDSIAIGAFHSMKNGILTSNSAGNSGPDPRTVTNVSPWSLSVAASTIDRRFVTDVQLGNGEVYEGVSINTLDLEDLYPLVYGGDVPNTDAGYNGSQSRYCEENSLDKSRVRGKIVLCDWTYNGTIIAGAVGAIMQDDGFNDAAFSFPISSTYLSTNDGNRVYNYLYKTRKPTGRILKSTERGSESAPYVVSFSSRGPNAITSDILKPDLSAPGVDILAAWSEGTTVTGDKQDDKRVVPYNIISGTSMACPHATAAALYVKSFNPTMSPAAIKSALMTTATPMSSSANSEAEFAYGSGQINPIKAANPGLVYDMGENDYVKFLCGQGYSTKNLRIITGAKTSCTFQTHATHVWDLNYPSFTISSSKNSKITRVFHRTVTNVGTPVSTYRATIVAPAGLTVRVEPSLLSFISLGQKQSFVVSVTAEISESVLSGSLVWDDGVHLVRSPIVAYAST